MDGTTFTQLWAQFAREHGLSTTNPLARVPAKTVAETRRAALYFFAGGINHRNAVCRALREAADDDADRDQDRGRRRAR